MGNNQGKVTFGRHKDKHRPDTRAQNWSFHSMNGGRSFGSVVSVTSSSFDTKNTNRSSANPQGNKYRTRSNERHKKVSTHATVSYQGDVVRILTAPDQYVRTDFTVSEKFTNERTSAKNEGDYSTVVQYSPTSELTSKNKESFIENTSASETIQESKFSIFRNPRVKRVEKYKSSKGNIRCDIMEKTNNSIEPPKDTLESSFCFHQAQGSFQIEILDSSPKRRIKSTNNAKKYDKKHIVRAREETGNIIQKEIMNIDNEVCSSEEVNDFDLSNKKLETEAHQENTKMSSCVPQSDTEYKGFRTSSQETFPSPQTLPSDPADMPRISPCVSITTDKTNTVFPFENSKACSREMLWNMNKIHGLENVASSRDNPSLTDSIAVALEDDLKDTFREYIIDDLSPISSIASLSLSSTPVLPLVIDSKFRTMSLEHSDNLHSVFLNQQLQHVQMLTAISANGCSSSTLDAGTNDECTYTREAPKDRYMHLNISTSEFRGHSKLDSDQRAVVKEGISPRCSSPDLEKFCGENRCSQNFGMRLTCLEENTNSLNKEHIDIAGEQNTGSQNEKCKTLPNQFLDNLNGPRTNICGRLSDRKDGLNIAGKGTEQLREDSRRLNLPIGSNQFSGHSTNVSVFAVERPHNCDANVSLTPSSLATTPTTTDSGYNTGQSFVSYEQVAKTSAVCHNQISDINHRDRNNYAACERGLDNNTSYESNKHNNENNKCKLTDSESNRDHFPNCDSSGYNSYFSESNIDNYSGYDILRDIRVCYGSQRDLNSCCENNKVRCLDYDSHKERCHCYDIHGDSCPDNDSNRNRCHFLDNSIECCPDYNNSRDSCPDNCSYRDTCTDYDNSCDNCPDCDSSRDSYLNSDIHGDSCLDYDNNGDTCPEYDSSRDFCPGYDRDSCPNIDSHSDVSTETANKDMQLIYMKPALTGKMPRGNCVFENTDKCTRRICFQDGCISRSSNDITSPEVCDASMQTSCDGQIQEELDDEVDVSTSENRTNLDDLSSVPSEEPCLQDLSTKVTKQSNGEDNLEKTAKAVLENINVKGEDKIKTTCEWFQSNNQHSRSFVKNFEANEDASPVTVFDNKDIVSKNLLSNSVEEITPSAIRNDNLKRNKDYESEIREVPEELSVENRSRQFHLSDTLPSFDPLQKRHEKSWSSTRIDQLNVDQGTSNSFIGNLRRHRSKANLPGALSLSGCGFEEHFDDFQVTRDKRCEVNASKEVSTNINHVDSQSERTMLTEDNSYSLAVAKSYSTTLEHQASSESNLLTPDTTENHTVQSHASTSVEMLNSSSRYYSKIGQIGDSANEAFDFEIPATTNAEEAAELGMKARGRIAMGMASARLRRSHASLLKENLPEQLTQDSYTEVMKESGVPDVPVTATQQKSRPISITPSISAQELGQGLQVKQDHKSMIPAIYVTSNVDLARSESPLCYHSERRIQHLELSPHMEDTNNSNKIRRELQLSSSSLFYQSPKKLSKSTDMLKEGSGLSNADWRQSQSKYTPVKGMSCPQIFNVPRQRHSLDNDQQYLLETSDVLHSNFTKPNTGKLSAVSNNLGLDASISSSFDNLTPSSVRNKQIASSIPLFHRFKNSPAAVSASSISLTPLPEEYIDHEDSRHFSSSICSPPPPYQISPHHKELSQSPKMETPLNKVHNKLENFRSRSVHNISAQDYRYQFYGSPSMPAAAPQIYQSSLEFGYNACDESGCKRQNRFRSNYINQKKSSPLISAEVSSNKSVAYGLRSTSAVPFLECSDKASRFGVTSLLGEETHPVRNITLPDACPGCHSPFDNGRKRKLIESCGHGRCYTCVFDSLICPVCVTQSKKMAPPVSAKPKLIQPTMSLELVPHPDLGHRSANYSPNYCHSTLIASRDVNSRSAVSMATTTPDQDSDISPPPPPGVAQKDLMTRLGFF